MCSRSSNTKTAPNYNELSESIGNCGTKIMYLFIALDTRK